MFLVRNIFHTKPGRAKELVSIFKNATPHLKSDGIVHSTRILTDATSTFWTVVFESEVEDLNKYLDMARVVSNHKELGESMKGYMDLVNGGYREISKIE